MVVVRLNGGLGNQLFQYAAGFALAKKNGDVLKLDIGNYLREKNSRDIYRNFDLEDFLITAELGSLNEVRDLKNPYGIFSSVKRLFEKKILKKFYIDWHPEVLKRKGSIYLEGYFQSENYFLEIRNEIFGQFRLKPELYFKITSYIEEIKQHPVSISLHVRRGDYAENPRTREFHLVCDISYYERAIAEMQKIYPDMHLYIFSDDTEWVIENLPINAPATYISNKFLDKSLKPSQELVLMSHCDHHILSNSSFSWWAAYLNLNPNKKVVAPSKWFGPAYEHFNTKDLLPKSWIKL
jgi:DNA-binding Lrp family transcriptional regulator